MDNAFLMRCFECIGDLLCDSNGLILRNWSFLEAFSQSRPIKQFHHEIVGADVIELADAGMVERGDGACFALESLSKAGAGNLDGDIAAEPSVAGAVDLAHATVADWL